MFSGWKRVFLGLFIIVLCCIHMDYARADETTVYNGVDYSRVYDYEYYKNASPDVYAVYGDNPAALLEHFVNEGMAEGRRGNESFNVRAYRNAYQDLRLAFGDDLKAYYMHYIERGWMENRRTTGVDTLQNPVTVLDGVDYSAVYDYEYYKSASPDVYGIYGDDDLALLRHFVNNGMAEGRRGSESFNVQAYRNAYQDLRLAFGDDLKAYYMHYINHGQREGRRTTGVDTLQNPVTVMDGVDYSAVYDYNYYIKNSPDVYEALGGDEIKILAHFVDHGMDEGRRGNEEFNVRAYRNRYQDLRVAFRDDLKAYYLHYINFGQKEGRQATGTATLQNPVTILGGIDFSDVYDYYYYINRYSDLKAAFGDDDIAALQHFASSGIQEGRQGKEQYDPADYAAVKEKIYGRYPKAKAVLDHVGWNLQAAYDWSVALTYYGHTDDMPQDRTPGSKWYADYGFDNLKGNCYVMAATFYEMARELGYSVRQIEGGVEDWGGGYNDHSWTEIDLEDGTFIFDPNYTNETGRNGWKLNYGQSGTWKYKVYSVMSDEPDPGR